MMPDITLTLEDSTYDRLEETADSHDITVEDAATRAIKIWNDNPHSDEEWEQQLNSRF